MALNTPIFHVRGDSKIARVSQSGATGTDFYQSSSVAAPAVSGLVATGCFGSSVIDIDSAGFIRAMAWPGMNNISQNAALTVLYRFQFKGTSGLPPTMGLFQFSAAMMSAFNAGLYEVVFLSSGKLQLTFFDPLQLGIVNVVGNNIKNDWVADKFYDVWLTWDGTSGASKIKIWISDDSTVSVFESFTASRAATNRVNSYSILVGSAFDGTLSRQKINEFAIWNTDESANIVTRSAWLATTALDATQYTVPADNHIRSGQTVVRAGVAGTPSLIVPALSDTKIGVAGDGGNGTYDGSDRWTSPAASDLRSGSPALKSNSLTPNLNGSLVVPSLANTKIGVAGDGGLGTYNGSDRWTAPAPSDYSESGPALKNNSLTPNLVGTLHVPVSTDPGEGNVARNQAYMINDVPKLGTRDTVTNVFEGGELLAPNQIGILEVAQ